MSLACYQRKRAAGRQSPVCLVQQVGFRKQGILLLKKWKHVSTSENQNRAIVTLERVRCTTLFLREHR